ncbi:MAG: hypothetical protein NC548_42755 [Lachnospiraceae bacterium]|nr:hypothetical protein [Lachnospiraceae bacterium]
MGGEQRGYGEVGRYGVSGRKEKRVCGDNGSELYGISCWVSAKNIFCKSDKKVFA